MVATRRSVAGEGEAEGGREGEMVRFIDFFPTLHKYLLSIYYVQDTVFPVGCYRAGLGFI